MKLLMFQARRFWYRPYVKSLPDAPDAEGEHEVTDAAVIWIHAEEKDPARRGKVLSKMLKNIKWLANKRDLERVVLHSFTHLSDSKADPIFAQALLQEAGDRLRRTGYEVWITPFGYVCEWELSVRGESLGRVFKSL
jgi:hypothetical protein